MDAKRIKKARIIGPMKFIIKPPVVLPIIIARIIGNTPPILSQIVANTCRSAEPCYASFLYSITSIPSTRVLFHAIVIVKKHIKAVTDVTVFTTETNRIVMKI